jgi:hypothetical protein
VTAESNLMMDARRGNGTKSREAPRRHRPNIGIGRSGAGCGELSVRRAIPTSLPVHESPALPRGGQPTNRNGAALNRVGIAGNGRAACPARWLLLAPIARRRPQSPAGLRPSNREGGSTTAATGRQRSDQGWSRGFCGPCGRRRFCRVRRFGKCGYIPDRTVFAGAISSPDRPARATLRRNPDFIPRFSPRPVVQ